jgi:putative oxidoreductase
MRALLASFDETAYVLLRVVSGLLFAFHGARKLFGLLAGHMPEIGSQLWVGGVIELVAGMCVLAGLLTQVLALVASGMMAVAYVQYHWQFELGAQLLPAKNQGELAVLYCLVFFAIACRGGGRWSLDRWLLPWPDPYAVARTRQPRPVEVTEHTGSANRTGSSPSATQQAPKN